MHRSLAVMLAAPIALLVACGSPPSQCPAGAACAVEESPVAPYARVVATAALASPTPGPPPPGPPSSTAVSTATLMPPDPRSVTPRPTDPPFTPRPRPRMPVAADIRLGPDGRYSADAGGCHWSETARGAGPPPDGAWVVLQTACLPYEGLHYYPATGAVDYFVA